MVVCYDALGQCYDLSTCRSASTLPLCQATDESCKQSNETIEWILQEFRNTPVSSTELLAQDTLENLANQTFESAIKLGSLISTTPVKTVEAWASANVPNLASMAGRGQEALSFAQGIMDLLKNFTLIALRDGIFANATAAEKKMYEDGANYQWNDDYFPLLWITAGKVISEEKYLYGSSASLLVTVFIGKRTRGFKERQIGTALRSTN